MAQGRILVVEDEDNLRRVIEMHLENEGFAVATAGNSEQAIRVMEAAPIDLVLADLHLPGKSGLDLLKLARPDHPDTVFILMTAFGTVQSAVDALKAGAYDYLTKPIHHFELTQLVCRALEHNQLTHEVGLLRSCLDKKYGFEKIIGSSEPLMHVFNVASRAAASDATILIQGETGTGKEIVAKAIHFRSPRRDHPFVTINCGAIPRELLESELFGHMRGSFTGALTHKKGRVEAADCGTVFLDEIGEMPLELQVRVLRLIQEREIDKIGATKPTKVDVRIIAATHRNLEELVKTGAFRDDLYFRLAVVPIDIPPLRERPSDIPELVQHFFDSSRQKHSRQSLRLRPELMPKFQEYKWPGNVRELENLIERLVVLSDGDEISLRDLPERLRGQSTSNGLLHMDLPPDSMDLAEVEKELILKAMRKFSYNQTQTARYLGLTRKTFLYRLKRHGIKGTVAASKEA